MLVKPGYLAIPGDFNFHFDQTNDCDHRKFAQLLASLGLSQLITQPTHKKGHILDLLIVREAERLVTNISIGDTTGSDHSRIDFGLRIAKDPPTRTTVKRRRLAAMDRDSFCEKISALQSPKTSDPDQLCQLYKDIVTEALDELAPEKTRISNDTPRVPWWKEELLTQRKKVRELEARWRSSNLEVDKQIFSAAQNDYYRNVDAAKEDYHRNRISSASSKQLFVIVDELVGGKKALSNIISTNIPPVQIAGEFASFFENRVKRFRETMDLPDCTPGILPDHTMSEFTLVSDDFIRKLTMNSASKSCILDPMTTTLLKECLTSILPFFTCLVNSSLQTGIVPNIMKEAVIRPLLKKAGLDPDVLKNYRPVANVPFGSKIIENMCNTKLISIYN